MIFVNNPGAGGRVSSRSLYGGRRVVQFGSLSRNSQSNQAASDESDNFLLGCVVISFGIAITLALVLLPLSICCSRLIYHPLYLCGLVLFLVLTLLGIFVCICHPVMTRCWWYKDQGISCSSSRRNSAYR